MNNIQKNELRILRKKYLKKTRYESHLHFLQSCQEQNILPKGFKLKWTLGFEATQISREKVQVYIVFYIQKFDARIYQGL